MTLFTKKADENENKENTSLGSRIAALRKSKGYTQEEFSDIIGVSPQAVSKWENDISCPDIMLLPKISSILGISIDELLTGNKNTVEEKAEKEKEAPAVDTSKLKLRINIFHPDKKPVNVSLPFAMVKNITKIGNGISGIIGNGSISSEQMSEILKLVENGVTGELLNVTSEDDTNIVIEIS